MIPPTDDTLSGPNQGFGLARRRKAKGVAIPRFGRWTGRPDVLETRGQKRNGSAFHCTPDGGRPQGEIGPRDRKNARAINPSMGPQFLDTANSSSCVDFPLPSVRTTNASYLRNRPT